MRSQQEIAELFWAAARRLGDAADKAYREFESRHAPKGAEWRSEINGWLGGPIGEYAAIISPPLAGAALSRLFAEWAQTVPCYPNEPEGLACQYENEIALAEQILAQLGAADTARSLTSGGDGDV